MHFRTVDMLDIDIKQLMTTENGVNQMLKKC